MYFSRTNVFKDVTKDFLKILLYEGISQEKGNVKTLVSDWIKYINSMMRFILSFLQMLCLSTCIISTEMFLLLFSVSKFGSVYCPIFPAYLP